MKTHFLGSLVVVLALCLLAPVTVSGQTPFAPIDVPAIITSCDIDLYNLLSQNYPNAAQMLLASGKGPTDAGNYDMCQDLDDAHYCVFVYEVPAIWAGIDFKTGLCVPINCTETDFSSLSNFTRALLPHFNEIDGVDVYCALKHMEPISNDKGALVVVALLVLLAVLGLVGGIVEWINIRKKKQRQSQYKMQGVLSTGGGINDEAAEPPIETKRPPLCCGLLMAFSPITNFRKLVQPTSVPHLASLNGLRVFSMFWVILGHTVFWAFFSTGFDNAQHVNAYWVSSWFSSIILNGTLSVDSFFYLSGFLVAYLGMKELYKKGKINMFLYYFHRIYRLTPPYFVALLVLWKLLPYFGEGPWWKLVDTYVSRTSCDTYWWTNLLYINNFYPIHYDDQCMGWSWYLANDWQMYVVSPIFLYLYYKNRRLGVIVIDICLVASLFAAGIVEYTNNFSAYVPSMTANANYQDWVYEKFYMRIPVYFVGMLAAFLLLELEKRGRERIKWYILWPMYIVSGLLMYFAVFGSVSLYTNNGNWSRVEMVMYLCFPRVAFATGVAMLLHTFYLGHGYLLRKFFEWHVWSVLARLTFSAYLYHPIIMSVIFFGSTTFFHYSAPNVALYWFGFMVASFSVSTFSYLLIERPLMNLEKFFLGAGGH